MKVDAYGRPLDEDGKLIEPPKPTKNLPTGPVAPPAPPAPPKPPENQ